MVDFRSARDQRLSDRRRQDLMPVVRGDESGWMTEVLRVVSGSANPGLATAVASHLGVESDGCSLARFPDGELRPTIENICGADVYVVQPTAPPVNEHIVELLLLLDACRRSRAARVTAVVPYFGYARQDRRTAAGQALGSTVIADAIVAAGADRLVAVDPHTPALEAQCRIPVETLSAVPTLVAELAAKLPEGAVVVALTWVRSNWPNGMRQSCRPRLRSCASNAKVAQRSAHWTSPAMCEVVRP
jgi:hypothetical protein